MLYEDATMLARAAEIALAVELAAKTSGSPYTVGTVGLARGAGAITRALLRNDEIDPLTPASARDKLWTKSGPMPCLVCRGVKWERSEINADPAVARGTLAIAEQVCRELGIPNRRLVSRAYHDSLFMARLCPTTMIFIPCRNGWSHRPEEYASPDHIAGGVTVLAHTLARLAG